MSVKRMGAAEAAARLGVKRETLYAYVSRGMLESQPGEDGRSSTYDRAEVEALARKRRSGGRAGSLDVLIGSAVTLIEHDCFAYRGHDVPELARTTPFENVAELLWTGRLYATAETWPADAASLAAARAALAPVPERATPADRLRSIIAAVAPLDSYRVHLRPESVTASGRRLIAALVDGLPSERASPRTRGTLAERLWTRLTPRAAGVRGAPVLTAAWVLLADHGWAASTLAARVAASVRADPYAVATAGLSTVSGPYHGAASGPVYQLLADTGSASNAPSTVADYVRDGRLIFGFGHPLYPNGDPRAPALLAQLRDLAPRSAKLKTVEAVREVMTRHSGRPPNVDFALAALAWITGMPKDAGETIFSISRVAGWLAHALEEYGEPPVRFRPRAHYTGPRP